MLNINNFSSDDLIDFGMQYYEILGVEQFNQIFVKPLGYDIINKISHKVNLKTPLSNHKILAPNKERISFIEKIFFSSQKNKSQIIISSHQIPPLNFSFPIVKFKEIELRKHKVTSKDAEIIKLCIEEYIIQFGYEEYMSKILEFIFEIFNISSQRFSELFQSYKKNINFISKVSNEQEIENIKRKILLDFSTLDKQLNSPFIVVVTRLQELTYEWIEMDCSFIIYQSKSYINFGDEFNFFITHDEEEFKKMISKIPSNEQTSIRIEFFNKYPKKKGRPTEMELIQELQRKTANSNQEPLIKKSA